MVKSSFPFNTAELELLKCNLDHALDTCEDFDYPDEIEHLDETRAQLKVVFDWLLRQAYGEGRLKNKASKVGTKWEESE